MKLVLAITAALFCSTAEAATVRMYTPGGAPCAGACGYDWAVEKFNVPRGEPMRMTIPSGSYVSKMSYAKKGVPYAIDDAAVLAEDEPGEGYFFKDSDGVTLMMAKLDKCENWAVMMPPEASATSALEVPPEILTKLTRVSTEVGYTSVFIQTGGDDPLPPVIEDPHEPTPVPLPVSALCLLFGLGVMGAFRVAKGVTA